MQPDIAMKIRITITYFPTKRQTIRNNIIIISNSKINYQILNNAPKY